MARIALAWEYGASFGHAAAVARLGDALRQRGHTVSLMLRELRPLQALPETRALTVFQAPAWTADAPNFTPRSFAEVMVGAGYRDPVTFSGILSAWHVLFAGWKPDLVIGDYAPTALIAARALGIRRATYGNGFFTPPAGRPMPPFRTDLPAQEQDIANSEAFVLGIVNGALERLGAAPLEYLAQQFEVDEHFLCTFPELDHYFPRSRVGYWGPRMSIDRGRLTDWPEGRGKRVLVYLPATQPSLDDLFRQLRARGAEVVAYIPRLDAARRAAFASPHIRMSEGPVRLDRLLARCDLMVSLGGDIAHGTLAFGIPQLLFPQQFEQHITALRMETLGAALAVRGPGVEIAQQAGSVAEPLERVLQQPGFTLAARAFRARYPAWSPQEQLRRVVARTEELVR
ncbi:hypothetical protein DSM104443_03235 [Usitatibacter rugosus]|uniref:Erythromycin biosynthesis protein CIII-like C-terminal domain-containing protein n=1 Tax=Usitatibacter rugosus TaxID=2732067 RepID=A0A6M4GXY7_9PROT|nr:nucleotide disphospho-sugar-binding domain-containing protein [Usitatibacter rugosus]QJR12150.1 hypothetical protein DSM104443_03235 [Usitatibacter rugosus]